MALVAESVIKIKGLTKEYYNKVVVNNINLEIPNSCFAFLGPNGAGKTTTILMLLGLVRPTSGKAFILGNDITINLNKIRKKISFLPENVGFYPNLTAKQFLNLILSLRSGKNKSEDQVEASLKWSGLKQSDWEKKIKAYSRGMKQRLGLAQAFIGDPELVFLDEPLSNIDPMGREMLIKKIREKRRQGITIVISSHIILEIEQLADFVAFIDKGEIKASDKIYNLTQSYGLNEYEITRISNGDDVAIEKMQEILGSEGVFSDSPKRLSEKIIFQTNTPQKVAEIVWKHKDFSFTPISGTLNKLYKKIVGIENNEKSEEV
ncbi:MAG: ABC transporter ATP-binding protein [Candidatus Lokiarchaeota archaeon]|nr:ABC transporter ATP-binding protein [Candidatus Lokiarchaeota archaeon]